MLVGGVKENREEALEKKKKELTLSTLSLCLDCTEWD